MKSGKFGFLGSFSVVSVEWSPLDLNSPPKILLDDQSAVTDVSGAASVWADRSGNSYDFSQGTAANRPLIIDAELNGKRVLRFDGSNDKLLHTGAGADVFRNTGTGWAFTLYKKRTSATPANSAVVFYCGIDATNVNRFNVVASRASNPGFGAFAARRLSDATGIVDRTVSDIGEWVMRVDIADWANGDVFLWANGVLDASNTTTMTSGNTANTAGPGLVIAAGGTATVNDTASYSDIDAAVVIIGSGSLPTLGDIARLFGWAAWRYGLVSQLPTSHPYKLAPPDRVWTPLDLTQPAELWLDWNSDMTIVSGRTSAWENKGTLGGSFAQPDSGARPTVIDTDASVNGKRVVSFDGSNDLLYANSGAVLGIMRNVNKGWIFVVYKKRGGDVSSANRSICVIRNNASSYRFGLAAGGIQADGQNRPSAGGRRLDGDAYDVVNGSVRRHGVWSFVAGVVDYSTTNLKLFIDAELDTEDTSWQTAGNTSNTASGAVVLGGNSIGGTADCADIDLALVIAGATPLSTADLDRLHGWAAWELGLEGTLPVGHPYKLARPMVEIARDPYYGNVVSLLHFNGPDASVAITDETGRVWTPAGNAQLDTAFSRWGGASLLLDGSGDYMTTPHDNLLNLSGGDGTLEFSIRPSSVSGVKTIISKRHASGLSTGYSIGLSDGKLFAIAWGSGASTVVYPQGTTVLTAGVWYDITLRVSSSAWEIYIGDTLEATAPVTGTILDNSEPVFIGRDRTNGARDYAGHIDEIRWTEGVARTIATPTGPFPNA